MGVDRENPAVRLASKLPTDPKLLVNQEQVEAKQTEEANTAEWLGGVIAEIDFTEAQKELDEFENYKSDLQSICKQVSGRSSLKR